jgi:GH18 family chitinase
MLWKIAIVCCLIIGAIESVDNNTRVVCYYDTRAYVREGVGKVTLADIEAGLNQCTHLVIGYTSINDQKRVVSLNAQRDLDHGNRLFREATNLKAKHQGLKVLLGVGGDISGEPDKWLQLLEQSTSRIAFINSAYDLIKTHGFDGLDLAFEFPKIKIKKERSGIGSFFYSIKKAVGAAGNPVDAKSDEHKEEFTALVRELKNSFRHEGYLLTITINPNVNSSLYLDVPSTVSNFDWINVAAYDYQTPQRYKDKADYAAPLFTPSERNPELNANFQVTDLVARGVPSNKIVLGIPTFGRGWNIKDGATATGVPPVDADGPTAEGMFSKQEGLFSYGEICAKLTNPQNKDLKGENAPVRKVGDPSKRFGPYGYRLPDKDGNFGMWISYEDTDSATKKAAYVREKNLGGIAVMDLSYDDFKGVCTGDKFPILKSVRYRVFN